jgi:molecular chaperone GrpE
MTETFDASVPPSDEGGASGEEQPFTFTDNRKIDPTTGEARPVSDLSDDEVNSRLQNLDFASPDSESGEVNLNALAEAQVEVANLKDALARSQADYVNLRNRMTKQVDSARELGQEDALRALMPALDQIVRARSHNELVGPMAVIAGQIDDALGKLGFTRFGEVGDEFDPNMHEALMHRESAEATAETIETVIDQGYLNGEKVLRPAKVGVVGPL